MKTRRQEKIMSDNYIIEIRAKGDRYSPFRPPRHRLWSDGAGFRVFFFFAAYPLPSIRSKGGILLKKTLRAGRGSGLCVR